MSGNRKSSRYPVVVVGAGASGLTAIKACLEQQLDVICFEKTLNVGGLWRYREEVVDGVASVMKSTIINTSKEMTAFSDFPPPTHFPNFMHNKYMVRYLELYAEKFQLFNNIRFGYQVLNVEKVEDFEQNGEWKVKVQNEANGAIVEERASAVMICTGHHSYPYIPPMKDLSKFKGKVLHTHSYRHIGGFENKNVLVIGIGNSGGDMAVELSHIANKVYLSSRRGTWVMPRLGDYGSPIDIQYGRRYIIFLLNLLPQWFKNFHAEFKLNTRFHHGVYNLKPEHHFYSQHPMVNDDLPGRILSGSVTLKGNVASFTETGVVFEGEPTLAYPVDVVVFATGYTIRFPFLDDRVVSVDENRLSLYKHVFPTNLSHPTLSFVGFVQPFGSIPPISEVQSRWVVQVLTGSVALPSASQMEADVLETRHRHDERYVATRRHTIEVDGIPYLDEVAGLAGVKPRLGSLLVRDPKLFAACVFGPCVSYQYRLNGPHAWTGSRQAILRVGERVATPLNTRSGYESGRFQNSILCNLILFAVTVVFFVLVTVLCI